jgi:uncharacterized lipoprotein YmbA
MARSTNPFRYFDSSPEVIRLAVMMYVKYPLCSPGSVGVADAAAGNVLTLSVLEALAAHDGPRVVYAEGCTVPPERLATDGVVFKQVPYQLQAT